MITLPRYPTQGTANPIAVRRWKLCQLKNQGKVQESGSGPGLVPKPGPVPNQEHGLFPPSPLFAAVWGPEDCQFHTIPAEFSEVYKIKI